MDIRSSILTKSGIALAVAVLAMTGCTAGGQAGGPASKAPAAADSPTPHTATPTRDAVEADLTAAIRKAGIDPATGKSTAVRNGRKHPTLVDWMAAIKTPDAEKALPAAGAELERLGWRRDPDSGEVRRYRKGDWSLLASAMDEIQALHEGDSLLSFTVSDLSSVGAGADAS